MLNNKSKILSLKSSLLQLISCVVLLVFSSAVSFSQSSADCLNAINFSDSLGQFKINKGHGDLLEIKGNKITNEYLFTKEHNTTWVRISFTKDVTFSFELIPEFATDDFDFIVFSSFGLHTCNQIAENIPSPLRSNLSRVNVDSGSVTGLKTGYDNLYAPAGKNPNFSKPIEVLKGDTLFLVFDSPYGNKGGFTIKNTSVVKKAPISIFSDSVNDTFVDNKNYKPAMTIRVINENGDIVANPFVILKIGAKKTVKFEVNNVGELILREEINGKKGNLLITQKNYLQRSFAIEWDGIKDTIATFQIEKIITGSKLQFENINFAPNSSQILPESKSELDDLRTFLINNPQIFVEIGGHVNSAKKRNTYKLKKLSRDRARVIFEYLIDNGVGN